MGLYNCRAARRLKELLLSGKMNEEDYDVIDKGLNEISSLRERDDELEQMWEQFGDTPMDPVTERMLEPFLHFPPGTHREEIWHWFDHRHSKGVAYLLYGEGIDRTGRFPKLMYLDLLCPDCESQSCGFNRGGVCRFPLVHERKPRITDEDGCIDYDFSEGDE